MKKLILPILLLCLCGCSTTNISKLVQALSKDPATIRIRVTSVYGTMDVTRVGTTNGLTIAPDGTITTK